MTEFLRTWYAYLTTRFGLRVAVLLPALLLWGKWLADRQLPDLRTCVDFAIAALYVLAFRLGDDLADREQDCQREPERVICRASSVRPLLMLGLAASLVASLLVLATRTYMALATALVIHVYLAAWYALRGRLPVNALLNSHLVLAKYPLLVVVMTMRNDDASSSSSQFAAAAAATYLGLCVFEYCDDERLRDGKLARWLTLGETMGLAGLLAYLLVVDHVVG